MVGLISHTRSAAIIDIGSGYVGCVLLALKQSGASSVISSGHSRLSLEKRAYARARAHISEEITEAIHAAEKNAAGVLRGKSVSDARIVLHAPWTSSQIVTVAETYEKSTVIQAAHIAALAKKSLTAGEIDPAQLFERSVISVRLNGYPTSAPEGKRAESMELSAILSLGDPALKKNVESAVHAAFPAAKPIWVSAQNAYSTVLRRLRLPGDALIVDVGIAATHLCVLREGVPTVDRPVPEGLQGMLARVHGTEAPQETLALFRMYARDACESDACAMLQKAVASAEPDLVQVFGEHFAKLAETRRLPNTLVLIAHPDVAQWLASFFERIDFAQFTLTSMPFATRTVENSELREWIQADEHLDSSLSLAAAFTAVQEQST